MLLYMADDLHIGYISSARRITPAREDAGFFIGDSKGDSYVW
jgi:hypothetical protein